MTSPRRVSMPALLMVLCTVAVAACSASPQSEPPPDGGPAAGGGNGGDQGASGGAGGSSPSLGGVSGTGGAGVGGNVGGADAPSAGGAGAAGGGAAGREDGGSDAGAPEPTDGGSPGAGPSAACAGGALVPGPDGYQMLMSGGRMRKFLVRVPKSYDGKKPLGLIFALHGGGANGMSFETRIAPITAAVGDRAIFVYPDGLAPTGGGAITWARDYKDDLALVDAILAWAKEKICYDTARVFAWGQSSGAYFANTIGCHRSGIFRAIASNGGGVRPEEFMGCTGPVAAWISNGGMDPSHLPDAKKARDTWLMINGCTVANPVQVPPDPCISYVGCKSGFPLHYCQNTGGHDIPAYAPTGITDFFFGNFDK